MRCETLLLENNLRTFEDNQAAKSKWGTFEGREDFINSDWDVPSRLCTSIGPVLADLVPSCARWQGSWWRCRSSVSLRSYRPGLERHATSHQGWIPSPQAAAESPTKHTQAQCLSQDFDFFQKRSYLICLGSYLQKRGVIHSQWKLRDKARKFRERVRSLYITCPEYLN